MSHKLAGFLGMIGGAALFALEVRHSMQGQILNGATIDRLDEVFYALWALGMMAVFWAIYRMGVAGSKPWMRWAPLVAVVGFAAMAIGSIIDVIGFATPRTNPVFFIAWPAILIGVLLTAILILVSRRWAGWRKFAPLWVVLAIPMMLILNRVTGSEAGNALFGLAWMVLGLAVATTGDSLELQAVQA